MKYILTVAILIIAASVLRHLYRKYRQWNAEELTRKQVEHALDLSRDPETPWVKILVTAKQQMPAEEYEKFEKGVYELVENIGTANRSGLRSEAERTALLVELIKSSDATAKRTPVPNKPFQPIG